VVFTVLPGKARREEEKEEGEGFVTGWFFLGVYYIL
jgi:hypothetical protein